MFDPSWALCGRVGCCSLFEIRWPLVGSQARQAGWELGVLGCRPKPPFLCSLWGLDTAD